MPDMTLIDLSRYRLSKASETLATAKRDLNAADYASLIRNRSDYEDFYICSIEDTQKLVSGAEAFLHSISDYLQKRYTEASGTV